MTSSILGVIFVLIGFATMLIMIELRGNPKERPSAKLMIRFHKIFGYLFLVVFLFMLVGMISRTSDLPIECSPRIVHHVLLALSLGAILGLKILFARRYKRLIHWIMGFGILVFVMAFLLNALTAGYVFLHPTVSPETNIITQKTDSDILTGEELVQKKCTLCHTLERVNKADKNEDMWSATITRMAGYSNNKDFLSQPEKAEIVKYLLKE